MERLRTILRGRASVKKPSPKEAPNGSVAIIPSKSNGSIAATPKEDPLVEAIPFSQPVPSVFSPEETSSQPGIRHV